MRRRLLLSSLAVSLASLVLLCVPLGAIAAGLIRQDFTHRLDRDLQNAAAAIDDLTARGGTVHTPELVALVPADRRLVFTPLGGTTISAGSTSGPVQTATTTLPAGQLRMQAPLRLLDDRLRNIWLLIAGLGLAALAVAIGISWWESARLSRPLGDLAATAERLGRGDLRVNPTRYNIAELDNIADVLDRSAVRLAKILDDERRFSRETSHHLRTPLTSLSVRLEQIREATDIPEIHREADAALRQVERLTDVVAQALRPRPAAATEMQTVDLGELLRAQRDEWLPAFTSAHRQIALDVEFGCRAQATQGALEQVVATLLDNALTHGGGATTLTARSDGAHVRIDVTDQGPGVPNQVRYRIFEREVSGGGGTGLGLSIARSLLEQDGGRLELTGQRPTRFTAFLPAPAQ